MERFEVGMLVRSKCGHDLGNVYVIVKTDDTYIYLVDGQCRTLDRPKKKKRKHVQLINQQFDVASATDVEIKRWIKVWKREED